MKTRFLILTALLLAPRGLRADDGPATAARPNIVFILADDLGYGDVQCNNPRRGRSPRRTSTGWRPQGMRFTRRPFLLGVCSPSRYGMLTGRYHWRTRLQSGVVGPWAAPLIAPTG